MEDQRPGGGIGGSGLEDLAPVLRVIDSHLEGSVALLQRLLRQRSVSATGEGVIECAHLTKELVEAVGGTARLVGDSKGNPVVCGVVGPQEQGTAELILYCLYDVVPADGTGWKYPPFGATITDDGRIVARGACNTKGPLAAFLAAVDAYRRAGVRLPVRVRFVIEGEEEIGSPNLPARLAAIRSDLANGHFMFLPGVCPSGEEARVELMLGFKGMVYAEASARVRDHDVHSRTAPILYNAAWLLVHTLARLATRDGEPLVPGFSEEATAPSDAAREMARQLAERTDEDRLLALYGNPAGFIGGLRGQGLMERYLFSPTLNISGLHAGYTGAGSKTLNPAVATAKLDIRLVPGMHHERTFEQVQEYIRAYGGGAVALRKLHGYNASVTSPESPLVGALVNACTFLGREVAVFPIAPGSAPWGVFPEVLGHRVDHVWQTCAEAQSRAHAPNEFITVEEFRASAHLHAAVLHHCGRTQYTRQWGEAGVGRSEG